MSNATGRDWKLLSLVSLVFMVVVTGIAFVTRLWVLTAIPIGFLFGFFLERSDLCGSSAFSEVVLMKDARKLGGIWIAIVVSMLAFAVGSSAGWIALNPKPLFWANILVGGALFGIGIVLAGGCISGALFKSGQGNVNSMAALVGIPVGLAAVAHGPLHGLLLWLKGFKATSADGGSVTVESLMGVNYSVLASVIAVATLAFAFRIRSRSKVAASRRDEKACDPLPQRVLARPWKPWQSGMAIGLLALAAYVSSAASGRNYPLGTAEGVLGVGILATEYPVRNVWKRDPAPSVAPGAKNPPVKTGEPRQVKKVSWWMVGLVLFLIIGSHVSARLRGSYRLLPKPPDETIVAFGGGILLGAGAALGMGCVVGHIMSGVALMSMGSILFAIVVALSNWATTYVYMVGLGNRSGGI